MWGGTPGGHKYRFFIAWLALIGWHVGQLVLSGFLYVPPLPDGDGPDYESIGYSLSRGEGFQFAWQDREWQQPYRDSGKGSQYTQFGRTDWPGPTASRPPWLPWVIGLVYRVVPRGPLAFATVRLLGAVCMATAGAIAVWLAYRIAQRWYPKSVYADVAATVAFLFAILDRTIRTYNHDFLTEPWAMLWVMVIVAIALEWCPVSSTRWPDVGIGAVLGCLLLTRSIAVFWLPGVVLLAAWSARIAGRNAPWRSGAMVFVAALVVVCPWWIRNMSVLDAWMPLGGQGAASLRGGYCDEALQDWGNWHGDAENRIQAALDREPGSGEWTQAKREVALAERATAETAGWVREHLGDMPTLMLQRIGTHWGPYSGAMLAFRFAVWVGWGGLLLGKRPEGVWLLGLPLLSTIVVAGLYETGGRFLIPLAPLLYLDGAIGITASIHRIVRSIHLGRRANSL
ncbi:MAG: ArnT family glycosyltransferase [Pirellula sp.]